MIEICAIGSLRVTAALWNAGRLATDGTAKIAMITSQGGSIAWRSVQNAPGPDFAGDYGLFLRFSPCVPITRLELTAAVTRPPALSIVSLS